MRCGLRTKIQCGNCDRIFLEQWKSDRHICKEELSLFDRIKEWRRFRRTSETEKFLSALKTADTQLFHKVSEAFHNWKNAHPPGQELAVKEVVDPIEGDSPE